jgi:hypothetical protein
MSASSLMGLCIILVRSSLNDSTDEKDRLGPARLDNNSRAYVDDSVLAFESSMKLWIAAVPGGVTVYQSASSKLFCD